MTDAVGHVCGSTTCIPPAKDCATATSDPRARTTFCAVDTRTVPARRGSRSRLTMVWDRPVLAAIALVLTPSSVILTRIHRAMSSTDMPIRACGAFVEPTTTRPNAVWSSAWATDRRGRSAARVSSLP